MRDILLNQDDTNNFFKYFICDYLNINIIILKNDKYNIYSEKDIFEPYKSSIILYEYNNSFYFLSLKYDNSSIFTSDNDFILKIDELINIEEEEGEENVIEKEKEEIKENNNKTLIKTEKVINIVEEKKDYKRMKVIELKRLCKERKIKGYSKMKKNELIEVLLN
jgi:hypothetical protein